MMNMNRSVYTFVFGICIAMSLSSQACVRGSDESLEKELRSVLVEHVLPLIEKRGQGPIAIGGFSAATNVKGSAGPEIQLKLSRLLEQMDIDTDAESYRYEISGNYLPYNDPQSNLYGVKLITRIVDAEDGTTLGEFPRFVFGAETVPRLLGLNVSSKGGNDPKIQSVSFKKAAQSPDTFLAGAAVSASPVSPYSVEVLVMRNGQFIAVPAHIDSHSRPFAPLAKSDVYAIRLSNRSEHDAAVKLTIDGVNVFEFSEQTPPPAFWIVPKGTDGKPGTLVVKGWDKSSTQSIEFKVVDFPESAAARIKLQPSQTGLISASFSACWENESDRPKSEGRTRATGFGNEIVDHKTAVKRNVGHVRDVISIRYERDSDSDTPLAMRSR